MSDCRALKKSRLGPWTKHTEEILAQGQYVNLAKFWNNKGVGVFIVGVFLWICRAFLYHIFYVASANSCCLYTVLELKWLCKKSNS